MEMDGISKWVISGGGHKRSRKGGHEKEVMKKR
jgi:hypothetical protein